MPIICGDSVEVENEVSVNFEKPAVKNIFDFLNSGTVSVEIQSEKV